MSHSHLTPALASVDDPYFRNALDNQPTIMSMMEQLVKQQVAVRTWRPALAEAFEDQRFFARDVAAGLRWCPLIRAYILSDKLAVPDIVGESRR